MTLKYMSKTIHPNNTFVVLLLLILSFVVSVPVVYFSNVLNDFGVTNLVFLDGVNWTNVCIDLLDSRLILSEIRSSWLLFLFYSLFLFLFGVFGAILINYFLMAYFIVKEKVKLFPFLLFGPFFIVSSFLPSKEVLTLILTYLYFNFLFKSKYLYALLFSLFALLVRDAHGAFLMIVLFLFLIRYMNFNILIFSFISAVIVDKYLFEIQQYLGLFVLERTMGFFTDTEAQTYLVRVFGNITNASSRFTLFSNTYDLSLTGVTLMLSGIGVLMTFFLSIRRVFVLGNDYSKIYYLAFVFLLSIIAYSISPLIQPRYLIPLAFIYFNYEYRAATKGLIINSFFLSIFASVILRIFYIMTIGLPSVENYSFDMTIFSFHGFLK